MTGRLQCGLAARVGIRSGLLAALRTEPGKAIGKLKIMMWTNLLIVIALLAIFLLVKRSGQVSAKAAGEYLRNGAVVIDVRSAGEYTAGHLPQATNIPLSEIEAVIGRKVTNKSQVLLLHCQSGVRSAEARKKLKALGYAHAFNLGSYARAAQILSGRLG